MAGGMKKCLFVGIASCFADRPGLSQASNLCPTMEFNSTIPRFNPYPRRVTVARGIIRSDPKIHRSDPL